ncbi:MAG: GNAT family N-acetyltransferase [bacterium]|nr:GNAT family N-acetyltransferase [bacterium]
MTNFRVTGFEMAHWSDAADLFLAPECCYGTLQLPYQSRDEVKRKLENPPPNMHRLLALLPDGSRAVGLLALRRYEGRRAHSANIGMKVHPDFHGQGAGSALMQSAIELADRWLDLDRLQLTVFVDNERAIRLYEKFDFEREGTLRKYAYRDGEYVDTLAMARLR